MKGDAHITGLLLKHGANPNTVNPSGITPLHAAARAGHTDMARQLLDHGADINALDAAFNSPPLHLAKQQGHADMVKLLMSRAVAPPKLAPIATLLKSASATKGETKASACGFCHALSRTKGARGTGMVASGPTMWNIVNRPKASVSDYKYSSAMQAAKGTWNYEDLNAFLAHPTLTIPGTSMRFAGLSDPRDRADVIVFLRSISDDPAPLP